MNALSQELIAPAFDPMLIVGLTGGIGSGKTTVAERFAARGVPVIDADRIARELVEPGRPALARIVDAFGAQTLDAQGRLDRPRLRERVFADPERRRQLEALLHPLIRREMHDRLQRLSTPYCLLVIPLLLETGQADLVQRILVVDAPDELRYQRLARRDGLTREQVDAIMSAQSGRAQRLAAAHDVIVNDGDLQALDRRVEELHRRYLETAAAAAKPAV